LPSCDGGKNKQPHDANINFVDEKCLVKKLIASKKYQEQVKKSGKEKF
jgi:hypothetical protein